jgi:hypothetical protein
MQSWNVGCGIIFTTTLAVETTLSSVGWKKIFMFINVRQNLLLTVSQKPDVLCQSKPDVHYQIKLAISYQ